MYNVKEAEAAQECKHEKLFLVKSPFFRFFLWCKSCHMCWPPDGVKKEIGYCFETEKQARRFAKNHHMDILEILDDSIKDKKKERSE